MLGIGYVILSGQNYVLYIPMYMYIIHTKLNSPVYQLRMRHLVYVVLVCIGDLCDMWAAWLSV